MSTLTAAKQDTFKVDRNVVYRIYEKLDSSTPSGLKEIGRFKMTADTFEYAKCKYIGTPSSGRYDTGLDDTSVDFNGMQPAEKKKILEDRKELISYYKSRKESYLQSHPTHSETEFLASEQCGLKLKHGSIVDTSSLDNYLKLYFAFRGGQLTPSTELANPKYNSSLYVISKVTGNNEEKETTFDKEVKVLSWYAQNKENQFDDVVKILQYVGALAYGRSATPAVIAGLLKQHIKDVSRLEELIRAIEEVPLEEVYVKTKIEALIKTRVITRAENIYYFKGTPLGKGIKEIYDNLMKPENDALLDHIQNEK
jgi:hypothetical protein